MGTSIVSLILGAAVLAGLKATTVLAWLLVQPPPLVLLGLVLLSGVVLLMATRVAHHADELALRLGEPYGTLILTGSAIVVELALIASTMTTGEQNPTLARDSMFAVLMIALTGVKGISIFLASQEQERQLDEPVDDSNLASMNLSGSATYLSLISAISVLALVTPNFAHLTNEANFTTSVNVVLSLVAIGLYAVFLSYQTGSYRPLFTESASQAEWLSTSFNIDDNNHKRGILPTAALMAGGLLLLVLITESMGQLIETSITDLGLPSSMGGVLVGLLVLAPEALNAFQAASRGEVQRSLNTLYGSVLSTLCLTVPAVLLIGAVIHSDVILGLDPLEMVLLALTLFLVRPTTGRVSRLDGLVLLAIFLFWIALQVG
ncbi:Sodium-potassium/proton antiporter ChaA [Synechococcus sp. CBW1107]|nr:MULTISPECIES: sodium:calcium antiporter [unclassified Synechococcus]QVV66846.1 sodium:calcium antiporter [Synechococcus sp. LA31]CAK6698661.1 Sodium-potassium/proton antiporter ChaA [Synechococcus sp. CBW1107]